MSAGNTADKQSRRRAKRQAETPVAEVESDFEDDDVVEARAVTAGKGRATPSRRVHEEEEKSGNFITRTVRGMREYFEGVGSELRKVAWPTREDTQRLTLIVIVVMIASAIALGLVSLGFTELFRLGLASPVIFAAFFVIVGVVGFILYRRAQRSDASPY
jgi:preprotein translocase subunit SecE